MLGQDVYRFASVVFPSADDDVITSPYNSVLAIEQLNQHADCVLPVDNAALLEMIQKAVCAQLVLPLQVYFTTQTCAFTTCAGSYSNRVRCLDCSCENDV
eukprot:SAG31_NODE_59_length_29571_cov_20.443506_11_plen_100_part_00